MAADPRLKAPLTEVVVSRGQSVEDVDPALGRFEPEVRTTWRELVLMLTTHETRENKKGPYITRPMRDGGTRRDANAGDWNLFAADIDEARPEDLPLLFDWAERSNLEMILASTHSHTPENPRVRLWALLNRPCTPEEHPFLQLAFQAQVAKYLKLDPCMVKPSQPVYLPSSPAGTKKHRIANYYPGQPLDVNRLLETRQREIEELRRRKERAHQVGRSHGVRQPGGVIDYFNAHYPIRALLEEHGYERKTPSRYIAPQSLSRNAAVILYADHLISYHEPEHDPLARVSEQTQNRIPRDSFSAFAVLEHGDRFEEAFKAAAKWGQQHRAANGLDDSGEEIAELGAFVRYQDLHALFRAREMLVKSILDRGSITVVTGDPGSGKTTMVQHLVACIACGKPFAGHQVKPGRVLYISGEDQVNTAYRFMASHQEHGFDPVQLHENVLLYMRPFSILEEEVLRGWALALRAAVSKAGHEARFDMVVIDTKSRMWGGMDENDNAETSRFMRILHEEFVVGMGGAAVLLVHHLTKHKDKEEQSARGAGALIGDCDHEWRVSNGILAPGAKLRLPAWPPIRFGVRGVKLDPALFPNQVDEDNDTPDVGVIEFPIVNAPTASAAKVLATDAVLHIVRTAQAPVTLATIAKALHPGDAMTSAQKRAAEREVAACVEKGYLENAGKQAARGGGHPATLYRLSAKGSEYIESVLAREEELQKALAEEPLQVDAEGLARGE